MAGTSSGKTEAVGAERHGAEDESGHEHHGIRLEEVRRHAGAVAHVVTDVVGDGRGVAGVVLGDAGLDLADEVGADVGGLGEDASTDTHEHGEEGGAEAEALEHLGRLGLVEQDDDGGAEQAQSDGRHADGATGAEGDAHALVATVLTARGGGDADVGLRGQLHAEVADRGGEERADDEEAGATQLHAPVGGREEEQQPEDEHDEDAQRLELSREVGRSPLLDRSADLAHLVGSSVRTQDLCPEDEPHDEGDHGDDRDPHDQGDVRSGEVQRGTRLGWCERECSHSILLDGCAPSRPGTECPQAGAGWTLPGDSSHMKGLYPGVTALTPPHARTVRGSDGEVRLLDVVVDGRERLVDRVVDREDLVEPGDGEQPQDALVGAHHVQRAAELADGLEAPDEDTEPGRVEEADALEVDDDPRLVGGGALLEDGTQLGGGVDVDLTRDGHDDDVLALGHRHAELHFGQAP